VSAKRVSVVCTVTSIEKTVDRMDQSLKNPCDDALMFAAWVGKNESELNFLGLLAVVTTSG